MPGDRSIASRGRQTGVSDGLGRVPASDGSRPTPTSRLLCPADASVSPRGTRRSDLVPSERLELASGDARMCLCAAVTEPVDFTELRRASAGALLCTVRAGGQRNAWWGTPLIRVPYWANGTSFCSQIVPGAGSVPSTR